MAVFVTVATTDNDVFDAERGRALLHRRPFAAFGFIGARRAGRTTAAACGEAFGAALWRCSIAGPAEAGPGVLADQMTGLSSSNAVANRNTRVASTASS